MRTLLMQPTAAALCAVCIAAPVALHAGDAVAKPDTRELTVSAPAVELASLPSDPTLLEVLGLQIQTINNIINANTTGAQGLPPGFPLTAAEYASAFNVANAYIKIGTAVATQFVNGQFNLILPTAQTNFDAANATLAKFPPSVLASLGYDLAVIQNFFGNLGGASMFSTLNTTNTVSTADFKTAAASDVSVAALPSDPTLLEVLGLQIQTINNIINANTTGAQGLPPGFPIALANYASLYNVLNAYIKIGTAAATEFVNGQFNLILPTAQTNFDAANTTLAKFPPSVEASLGYDAQVVKNYLGGLGSQNITAKSATLSEPLPSKLDLGTPAKELTKGTVNDVQPPEDTTAKTSKPLSGLGKGHFLNQLQDAVDKQLGAGTNVKVDKPTKTDSSPFSGIKLHAPTPGSLGLPNKHVKKTDEKPSDTKEATN